MLAPPTSRRHSTSQYCGEPRLIQLHQEIRTGHAPAYLGYMLLQTVREPLCKVTASTVISQHLVTTRKLDCRSQRPRADALDLQRTGVAVSNLFKRVQVLLQQ